MSSGHQRITWCRNIAENFNRLSRVHERYRQTTDRQTDGRRHIANMNMSSRSLKIEFSGKYFYFLESNKVTYNNATWYGVKCCITVKIVLQGLRTIAKGSE